jgi:hypothetical protein
MPTTPSVTELVEQLDKTMVAYNQADKRSIAAYQSKDQQQDDAQHAEMDRLDKVERALQRAICASRATTKAEAIMQAIVASHLVRCVEEGSRRKLAGHAFTGLLSAISVLIDDLSEMPIATTVRRRYFDTPAKWRLTKTAGGEA